MKTKVKMTNTTETKQPNAWVHAFKFFDNFFLDSEEKRSVLEDMTARNVFGIKKYGVYLHPGNGRNCIQDIYEELLDGCVYTTNALLERGVNIGDLTAVPVQSGSVDSEINELYELLITLSKSLVTVKGLLKCN